MVHIGKEGETGKLSEESSRKGSNMYQPSIIIVLCYNIIEIPFAFHCIQSNCYLA